MDPNSSQMGKPSRSPYALPATVFAKDRDVDTVMLELKSVVSEIIDEEELRLLLSTVDNPTAYDGFEPSGRMHIAQGLMKKLVIDKMTKNGFTYLIWIADWFAMLNGKMDGDLDKIQDVGKYFIEIWKSLSLDMSRVKFLWCSEEINRDHSSYWGHVMKISSTTSLNRMLRCIDVMGRSITTHNGSDEPSGNLFSSEVKASAIMYPAMQCADIFHLGVDVCQLGLDQRKVNMLAREYASSAKLTPPIVMSHQMLRGLRVEDAKMSKSHPDSAIFMEDDRKTVERKIRSAWCPEKVYQEGENKNPVLEYFRIIVFPYLEGELVTIERLPKNGGTITYQTFNAFLEDYISGALHPSDVKVNLARYINMFLDPVRKHFTDNSEATELLERVKSYRVTR